MNRRFRGARLAHRIFQPRVALRRAIAMALALAVVLTPAAGAFATPGNRDAAGRAARDRFLVRVRPGAAVDEMRRFDARNGVTLRGAIPQIGVRVLNVPPGKTVEEMVRLYSRHPDVEFAEPDAYARCTLVPTDPIYVRQWAPAYVNAPAAWDISTGDPAVTIAVLDTGVDVTHPELAGRTVPGYDFVNGDADAADDNGHGTRVAGIAAATGNNGQGVAGMDWKARVMPVKVLDATGYGSWSTIAAGITYAADRGARVINMSLAGPASSTLQTAVRYAYGKGCVIAAAAGNEGSSVPSYPAGYAEVIAVGSVYRDALSSFSNYGPHLDVVAPGETIDTIAPGNTYGRFSGTSAATPFVAGLAALVLAAAPGASPTQVMSAITSTARDLGSPGWDQYYGFGHIDAAAALSALGTTPPPVNTEPDAPEPPTPPQDTQAPTVSITAPASGSVVSGIVTIRAIASDDGAVQRVEFYANGVLLGSDSTAPYQLDWNAKRFSGPYEIRAVAVDGAGNKTVSEPVLVTVQASIKTPPKKS